MEINNNLPIKTLEGTLLPTLKPLLRAYALGYTSNTAPRLLSLCLVYIKGKKKSQIDCQPKPHKSFLEILRAGLELHSFPTFCATLVGSYTILALTLRRLLQHLFPSLSCLAHSRSEYDNFLETDFLGEYNFLLLYPRLSKSISAFIAAWYSFELLHCQRKPGYVQDVKVDTSSGQLTDKSSSDGRTTDMTLNAVTRALDVIIGVLWSKRKFRQIVTGKSSKLENVISSLADSLLFSTSCAIIMFAFIYSPDRLPPSYNGWIKSAAATDIRLIKALRHMRDGTLEYGIPSERNCLTEMCEEYNWPIEWGDCSRTIPVPCQMVHMKEGPNCEYHAIARLVKSFFWALTTYLPLNMIVMAQNPSKKAVKRAIKSSMRSSLFLGSFISMFFYGNCLVRTRLGPRILGNSIDKQIKFDSGLGIATGCVVCGWSVLIENPKRRKELGLFVAPKAMATLLSQSSTLEQKWIEAFAFSLSISVLFTAVAEKPNRVRGLLGRVLQKVLVQ